MIVKLKFKKNYIRINLKKYLKKKINNEKRKNTNNVVFIILLDFSIKAFYF